MKRASDFENGAGTPVLSNDEVVCVESRSFAMPARIKTLANMILMSPLNENLVSIHYSTVEAADEWKKTGDAKRD